MKNKIGIIILTFFIPVYVTITFNFMQTIKTLNIKPKTDFKKILYILLGSIILALVYNTFSVDGIPYIRKPEQIEMLKSTDIIDDNGSSKLKGISLEQAINVFNNKKAIFIDARDQWDFAEGHIKGAINIPEFSFKPGNRLLAQIAKKRLIVVYCSGNDCSVSKRLAKKLLNLGYKNIYVYLGGYNEWTAAKLPVTIEKKNEQN